VDLDRPDARLWVASAPEAGAVEVPAGLLVVAGPDGARAERQDGGRVRGPATVLVWELDTGRPAWASD
jgi:hypothetical protein